MKEYMQNFMNPEGCLGANHTDACSPYKWCYFRIKKKNTTWVIGEKIIPELNCSKTTTKTSMKAVNTTLQRFFKSQFHFSFDSFFKKTIKVS